MQTMLNSSMTSVLPLPYRTASPKTDALKGFPQHSCRCHVPCAGPSVAQGVPAEAMNSLPSTTVRVLEGLPSIDGKQVATCPARFVPHNACTDTAVVLCSTAILPHHAHTGPLQVMLHRCRRLRSKRQCNQRAAKESEAGHRMRGCHTPEDVSCTMLHHAASSCCCRAGQLLLDLPGGLCPGAKGERAAQVPARLPCALRRQVAVRAQRLSSVPRASCLTQEPSTSNGALALRLFIRTIREACVPQKWWPGTARRGGAACAGRGKVTTAAMLMQRPPWCPVLAF